MINNEFTYNHLKNNLIVQFIIFHAQTSQHMRVLFNFMQIDVMEFVNEFIYFIFCGGLQSNKNIKRANIGAYLI